MSNKDRLYRAILGAFLVIISPVGIGVVQGAFIGWFAFVFGIANIVSSVTSWCFMYSLIGISSRSDIEHADDSEALNELPDFNALRRKTLIGFGSISILISCLYTAEGVDSAIFTAKKTELSQLDKVVNVTRIDLLEAIITAPSGTAVTAELLKNALYHFEQPLLIYLWDGSKFISASKGIEQSRIEQINQVFNQTYFDDFIYLSDTSKNSHEFHTGNQTNETYFTIKDTNYIWSYDPVEINGNLYWLAVVQQSNSAEHVIHVVLPRLITSSIVVLWLALWGGVAIAFFIWRNIEASNKRILTAALTDSITGLKNERALKDYLDNLEQGSYLICVVQFRNFAEIVATRGSEIANDLLNQLASKLAGEISNKCFFGRLNDGSFILISDSSNTNCIEHFRIQINQTQDVGSFTFSLEPTEAIIRLPEDVRDYDSLIKSVSALFRRANSERLASIRYNEKYLAFDAKKAQYAAQIHSGLKNHEFELFLQPKIDIHTQKVVGAEALARWNHPTDGLLSPASFIDIIESSNARNEFALFVIDEVTRLSLELASFGYDLTISFNLNAYDILESEIKTKLKAVIEQHPELTNKLEVELTETETSVNITYINHALDEIAQYGYFIALDDFGTGMSSLSYTHKLPIHTIKIDRAFIKIISDEADSHKPVKIVMLLADDYGFDVVAEGVETEDQLRVIKSLGCHICQGFFFAKPMPIGPFADYLSEMNTGSQN